MRNCLPRDYGCFILHELSEGVYAAIDTGKQCGSNAGFVDLGNISVIFDTFLNIDAARELHRLCIKLTGRKAAYVVNSHSHTDHIVGNSLFRDAAIISSKATQADVETMRAEFEKEKDTYPAEIESVKSSLAAVTDEVQAADLNNSLLFLTNLNKPGVVIKAPDMAFDGELDLHGSSRSLHLKSMGKGHSKGDVIASVSDAPICFMGDLLFKDSHPWLGSGDPESFVKSLDRVLQSGMERFVPGHGPLAAREDVLLMKRYIEEILALVQSRKSIDERDYSISDLSPVFHDWNGLCFSWNIKFLTGREKEKE